MGVQPMMSAMPIAVALGLALLLSTQAPAALKLIVRLLRRPVLAAASGPKVAVVLCVRGADETLARCLDGLLGQDYSPYEIVIVVDDESDPGMSVVRRILERTGAVNVRLEALTQRSGGCSLKCSALIQAVSGLDESVAVVAFIDADAVPHRTWLRELIAPLGDAHVGAATGVRWYAPSFATWGSSFRYLWNVPAIVCLDAFHIAWGGCLAIRREAFAKANLLEKWGKAYCEDTMTYAALKPAGMKLAFIPTLVLVNHDDCTVAGFCEWCVRQMLASRLYHPAWLLIVLHGLATTFAWMAPIGLTIWAAATGQWSLANGIGSALVAYWVIQWVALLALERCVEHVVARRDEPVARLSFGALWRSFIAIPITQAVYVVILLATMRVRRVCWRGIWYEINGPWDVQRGPYTPYSATDARNRC
jgi:cellulose synthase/poly-beta-1,6-N-acetylglucosamine synthase-like glycosyltransferase